MFFLIHSFTELCSGHLSCSDIGIFPYRSVSSMTLRAPLKSSNPCARKQQISEKYLRNNSSMHNERTEAWQWRRAVARKKPLNWGTKPRDSTAGSWGIWKLNYMFYSLLKTIASQRSLNIYEECCRQSLDYVECYFSWDFPASLW